jgi:hypothetical protein
MFSPAAMQSLTLFLIISRIIVEGMALLLNTLGFHSFQIVQVTSIVREVIAFRFVEALQFIIVHQDLSERLAVHAWVCMGLDGGDTNPILYHNPKPCGETIMGE